MSGRVPHPDPGAPDARNAWRYLWWLVKSQRARVARGALWGTLWMASLMLPPYLLARVIDDGLRARDSGALVSWVAVILAVGVLNAVLGLLRHRTMTFIRIDAAYRTVQVVVRHAARLGSTLAGRVSTGDITSVQSTDVGRIAQTLTITGPGVGAVIAYGVAAVQLFTISPLLAGVVLLGVPVLAVVVGPLVGRLRKVETEYREQQGALTARAGDIVTGLGVLCGIGGKAMFAGHYREKSRALRAEGYRLAAVTSWIQAVGSCLPVLFLAAVTWIAARLAAAGTITIGEMVAVYGYVAVLVVPVAFFIEGAEDLTHGLVAAQRVVRILQLPPMAEDTAHVSGPADPQPLHDPVSGLTIQPGTMSAIVADRPADAAAIVDRLGCYTDSDASWGDVPLSAMARSQVRRRILVADSDAHLFAGSLRDLVADKDETAIRAAVHAAVADDVVAGLPDGLDSHIQTQGRSLSGGQRARIRLVRALLTDPEVLILMEPTSAVDAHTEITIAERVRGTRHDDTTGRTTVVVGSSPLLADRADQVAYVTAGKVVATGTHGHLLATQPGYRALVLRDAKETTRLTEGAR